MAKAIRTNGVYTFRRAGFDLMMDHADVKEGQKVRVIRLPGAPLPGTMGQYHIEDMAGNLLGMVDGRSLVRD